MRRINLDNILPDFIAAKTHKQFTSVSIKQLIEYLVETIWMSLFVCSGELVRSLFYAVSSCNNVDITLRLLRRSCAVSILPCMFL